MTGTIDDIWWDIHGSAIRKLSHADRQKIKKFNIRRLRTNNRRHLFHDSKSANCSFCESMVEDNDHLIQCQNCSESRRRLQQEWELQIHDSLSSEYTPGEVKTVITAAIHCWIHRVPIPPIFRILPTATEAVRHAYEAQTALGWDNFIRGKISCRWAECIAVHLSSWGISPKSMTPERWATQLLLDLWNGVLAL